MARARAIGLVWVALLCISGPATAPSSPPSRAAEANAPSPCAPLAAIEIALGCAHPAASQLSASFLDADPFSSHPAREITPLPSLFAEQQLEPEAPARVPEPTSLLLLA
ncbi:MAG: hypothetical protein NTZ61_02635, partial [Proteobacteria bacterium]|nr:hypothetical protein [Pseudomonadota bacterium]